MTLHIRWLAMGLALTALSVAYGASLRVSPVTVQLAAGQGASSLTLRNEGDKALNAQVRVFAWTQENGQDVLTPTQTLLASPPMVQVSAQGTQTVRLVRSGTAPAPREESYRVLVDEIVDASQPVGNGVNVRLRYSIPIFVPPAAQRPSQVTMTATIDGKTLLLKAQNSGGPHAAISAVSVQNAAGESVVVEAGLVGYVLDGQNMVWRLNLPADATSKGRLVTMQCRLGNEAVSFSL